MKLIISLGLTLVATTLQADQPLNEVELQQLLPVEIVELQIPAHDQQTTNTQKAISKQPRPLMIARTAPVAKTLDSLTGWQTIDQLAVLRLKLDGNTAKHLNIGFQHARLPDSANLFILDGETNALLQQYDSSDIHNQQLWTPPFKGSSVIVELQVAANETHLVNLTLHQVGLGDKDFSSDSWLKSGSCNVDVACPTADNWRDVSRSVTRFLLSDEDGTYSCTGNLVNNDRFDQRPIILTAAHCLVAESTVASMVFFWNYETSVCGGTPDGSLEQVSNGATFISRGEGIASRSDFALVELAERPPFNFGVFFSGWNAIDQDAANVVTIHHPRGDEKRISVDVDPLTITPFAEDTAVAGALYYRIGEWEEGTTEGGSSGSGIWNQDKEIIGTLSGGDASCQALDAADWYGRMSDHWDSSGTHPLVSSNRALSPVNNQRRLSGLESCDGAVIAIQSDNTSPAVNQSISLSATLTGGVEPYQYAWDFDNDGAVDANDTNPAHAFSEPGNYEVYLMIDDANNCRTSARTNIIVPNASEEFLANGQIPDNLTKPDEATASWVVTDDDAGEGTFSLRTEIINAFETASIQRTDTFQAGTISFRYKTSTEEDFDSLRFYIDTTNLLTADGETDWTEASFPIAAGERTLRWEYQKGADVSDGVDVVWIDDIKFTPNVTTPTPTPQPTNNSGGGSMPLYLLIILATLGLRRFRY